MAKLLMSPSVHPAMLVAIFHYCATDKMKTDMQALVRKRIAKEAR